MRPTIVLGAGAFHVESVFRVFEPELQNFGYQTRPYALASIEKPGLVASDEIASLHALFYELIEVEGRDIVVYFHSYAGFSGSGAIAGWSKIEREAIGRKGGIVGLIYQAAFVPVGDVSMFKIAGPQWDMWYAPNVCFSIYNPSNLILRCTNSNLEAELRCLHFWPHALEGNFFIAILKWLLH